MYNYPDNPKHVDILLATFNGGRYLENQLLSLIGQTYKDWNLIIHDDGSSDDTIQIIEKFMSFDDRIFFLNDGVVCGGPAKNFLHLLSISKAPLVIFCDQDDIWFENKLSVLMASIAVENGPCAVYCNAYAYDGNEITANSVTLIHRENLRNSLFLNSGVQGCSLMFNRSLLSQMPVWPEYIYMHDHLLTIAAVTFGKLKYIDASLMFYRQHTSNVTGNVPTSFSQRLRTFLKNPNGLIDHQHYLANQSFYKAYKPGMKKEDCMLFEAYLSFPNQGYLKRVLNILNNGFKIGSSPYILLFKSLIRKPI